MPAWQVDRRVPTLQQQPTEAHPTFSHRNSQDTDSSSSDATRKDRSLPWFYQHAHPSAPVSQNHHDYLSELEPAREALKKWMEEVKRKLENMKAGKRIKVSFVPFLISRRMSQ